MKALLKMSYAKLISSPVLISVMTFVLTASIVIGVSFPKYDGDFLNNVLVEAHGMLFDILILGILVLWLNQLGDKHQSIKRYREEIRDFLAFDSKEFQVRIIGNIRRLNHLGVSNIYLNNVFFARANLKGLNLTEASLNEAILTEANLTNAILVNADLGATDARQADFSNADLRGADFLDADLTGADFTGADVTGALFDDNAFIDAYGLPGGKKPPWISA